ncbi:MAG: hypothetical protein H6R06_1365 [Proteobacteria bacterium]|jgi:plasmid stabilization system protein ParE|nr:hypothetical protein [Pseudomonadota bacterium]
MPRLIWPAHALRDVQRVHRFLAERNPDTAKRAIQAIRQGVKVLAKQTAIGRPVDDMEPEFREWLIDFGDSGYVVMYRFDGTTAVLLALRHQREAGF